ncbi:hypothetical protein V8G54_031124 [Vigna mungo]|uniref:Uncharacterized protein n=1 Tax=Vigna mungo TaxID=3915 RepID=A0AAQ3RKT0_VIGMU
MKRLKTAINRATSRNDLLTIRDALEVSSDMYKKDNNNVPDYCQRHLISLPIWEELRCVGTLSGERVLTASHDGTVKMWDVRTDRCVATVGRCSMLAAGGRDVYVKKKQCWSPGFPCAIQLFAIHCLCNA